MNYLIAKKKRTQNTYFNIISSEQEFYSLPVDLDPPHVYDNNYKLEDDEWFGIGNFTNTPYSILLLNQAFNSAINGQIGNGQYNLIKFFCAYQDGIYYFQKFNSGNLISRRWFNLTGEPELKINQPILVINQIPDAVFVAATNTLYFKKLVDIKSIFPETFNLYREATNIETTAFLQNNFINLQGGYNANMVKSANRKRIAMAMDTLASLKPKKRKKIFSYIRGYCPGLNFSDANSTFDIANEEHLKLLIYGIGEQFYTTKVGKIKRVANSVSPLQIP